MAVGGELVVDGISAGTIINIFDMSGKMVANEKSCGNTVRINIDDLQSGVYVMSAGKTVMKFIKK